MHAVLLMSASHLRFLQPSLGTHTDAAAYHLDLSLAGFRETLTRPLSERDAGATIACAFLLLHHAWCTPALCLDPSGRLYMDLDGDKMLSFASGLRVLIDTTNQSNAFPDHIFKKFLTKESTQRFRDWATKRHCSYDYERQFLGRSRTAARAMTEGECWTDCGALDAADRLAPIFRAIDAVSCDEQITDLMHEVQGYVLMWPAKSTKPFEQEVREKKTEALLAMLVFYASCWWLLSTQIWWMGDRSRIMCEAILDHFGEDVESQWDENLSNIRLYFGFQVNRAGKWTVGRPGYPSMPKK